MPAIDEGAMMAQMNDVWGPYLGPADAQARLFAFVNRSCGSSVGVAWAANGSLYPLRAPMRQNGFGDVAVFQWSLAPPRRRPPPSDFWSRAGRFIDRCMEQQAQAQMMEAQGNMAMGRMVAGGINRMFTKHRDDGLSVALDIICVVASIALLSTGVGVIAVAGVIGSSILLATDDTAYGMELGGNDEQAEAFKKKTEGLRLAATIATLPDLAWNGVRAVRELREVRSLLALDRTTARVAESLSTRTTTAQRAARYRQIAERANLRSQIRAQQIAASMKLEMAPRAAGVGGLALLVREEVLSDESWIREHAKRLSIHLTAVHK